MVASRKLYTLTEYWLKMDKYVRGLERRSVLRHCCRPIADRAPTKSISLGTQQRTAIRLDSGVQAHLPEVHREERYYSSPKTRLLLYLDEQLIVVQRELCVNLLRVSASWRKLRNSARYMPVNEQMSICLNKGLFELGGLF